MNIYNVDLYCGVYGKTITGGKAHTPYDIFERCYKRLPWRSRCEFTHADVMLMDGSKRTWTFTDKIRNMCDMCCKPCATEDLIQRKEGDMFCPGCHAKHCEHLRTEWIDVSQDETITVCADCAQEV